MSEDFALGASDVTTERVHDMAIESADIRSGWYWVVDSGFYYQPSIVFVLPWGVDGELVVLHHGVEPPEQFSEALKRYEFIARIEQPDFRASLTKAALEIMDSAPDVESLEVVDITPDGHRRRRH